jgi:hypothetical protein
MTPALLLALLLLASILLFVARCAQQRSLAGQSPHAPLLRHWRPRTPDDCPHCRLVVVPLPVQTPPSSPHPWREEWHRRGAPRRVPTEGYACRRPECAYFGITDAAIHALVADGHHGRRDRIQDFHCQACGSKVTARWGIAL